MLPQRISGPSQAPPSQAPSPSPLTLNMHSTMSRLLTLLLLAFTTASVSAQVVITNFGTGPTSIGWSYDSGTSTVSGSTDTGGLLQEDIPTTDIGANMSISLTATATGAPSQSFEVQLEDSGSSNLAQASFQFSEFNGGPTTITRALTFDAGFDPSDVEFWVFVDQGTSSSSFSLALSSMSAVPEPSTVGLLLATGLGALAFGRRRRA